MATNLFAPLSEQTKKDVLVEFRAGIMNKDSNSKWVRPDKRKGLVQLKLSGGDNIVHFVWKDRTTGTVAIDLMLFPDDATFRKVSEAKARVYVLEFKTSDKKLFFWMQEPKDDKDAQNCDNINKYINNPPQPGQPGGANAGAGAGLDLGGLDQNQFLQQLLRGAGGASGAGRGSRSAPAASEDRPLAPRPSNTTNAPQPAAPPTQTGVSRQALENLLAGFAQQIQPQQQQPKGPSLSDVVDGDKLINSGLFDNPSVVAKLAEFLPEGPVTAANLKENIRSPQFQQAVSMFNQALKSGQMAAIMSSFGLDASQLGPNPNIEDFLLAIQRKTKDEKKDMDTSQ